MTKRLNVCILFFLLVSHAIGDAIEDCDFLNETENCFQIAYTEFMDKVQAYNSNIQDIDAEKMKIRDMMNMEVEKMNQESERVRQEAQEYKNIIGLKMGELKNIPKFDDLKKDFQSDIDTLEKF